MNRKPVGLDETRLHSPKNLDLVTRVSPERIEALRTVEQPNVVDKFVDTSSQGAMAAPLAITLSGANLYGTGELLKLRTPEELEARMLRGFRISDQTQFFSTRQDALDADFIGQRTRQISNALYVAAVPANGEYNQFDAAQVLELRAHARPVLEVALRNSPRKAELMAMFDAGETFPLIAALREAAPNVEQGLAQLLRIDADGREYRMGDNSPVESRSVSYEGTVSPIATYSPAFIAAALQTSRPVRGNAGSFLALNKDQAIAYEDLVAASHDVAQLFQSRNDFERGGETTSTVHPAGSPPTQFAVALEAWRKNLADSEFKDDRVLQYTDGALAERLEYLEPLETGGVREWFMPVSSQAPFRFAELNGKLTTALEAGDVPSVTGLVKRVVELAQQITVARITRPNLKDASNQLDTLMSHPRVANQPELKRAIETAFFAVVGAEGGAPEVLGNFLAQL